MQIHIPRQYENDGKELQETKRKKNCEENSYIFMMLFVVFKLRVFTKWDLHFTQQDYNFNESIETEKRKATCSK